MALIFCTTTEGNGIRALRLPRLTPFLLLSVGVHTTLLFGHSATTTRIDAGTHTEVIAVRLDGSDAAANRPSVSDAKPHRATATQTVESVLVARTPQNAALQVGQSKSPQTHAAADDRRWATSESTEASARVRALVLSDLTRYFYYPALARARGWEGRVTLGFHVADDGQLRDPRVLHSSGFGVLDEAALNSLRKVERIAARSDAGLDLQVPVVYRLTDTR